MKVDLPTPGGPLMPMRMAPPVAASSASTQRDRLLPVVGPGRLDERDGPGQRPPVARRGWRRAVTASESVKRAGAPG